MRERERERCVVGVSQRDKMGMRNRDSERGVETGGVGERRSDIMVPGGLPWCPVVFLCVPCK